MASFGRKKSSQSSQQQQTSRQFGQSFVDPRQQPFQTALNLGAFNVAGGQLGAGGIGDVSNALSGQLSDRGSNFLNTLQGAGQGVLPGTNFLEQRLSEQNPFLNQQISQLGSDLGQQFQQQILPGIRRGSQVIGAQGGGRQGVAEGLASQGVSDAFARQAGSLRFQDVTARQGAAGALAGFGLGQQQLQAQGAQAGLGSLADQFNLGIAPFAAQFAPLQALSDIVGAPTVLNRTSSFSQATGSSRGRSSGFNFGIGGTLPALA